MSYVVSIGWNCEVTRFMRYQLKLNIGASPFDWNQVISVNSICDLIENRFSEFMDDVQLKKELPIIASGHAKNLI